MKIISLYLLAAVLIAAALILAVAVRGLVAVARLWKDPDGGIPPQGERPC